MIIEILDGNGDVITNVSGASDPTREVARHGGTSWREWIEPAEVETNRKRRKKITALASETAARIEAVFPEAAGYGALILVLSNFFNVTGQNAGAWNSMKDIGTHAKNKRAFLEQATLQEIEDYDPATDPEWPQ